MMMMSEEIQPDGHVKKHVLAIRSCILCSSTLYCMYMKLFVRMLMLI